MRGREVAQKVEPEDGKLGQHAAFVGNAGGQDVVEGGDAVRGDEQNAAVDAVHVAHFSARMEVYAWQFRFQNDGSWIGDHVVFRLSIGGVFSNILRCARKSMSIATEGF